MDRTLTCVHQFDLPVDFQIYPAGNGVVESRGVLGTKKSDYKRIACMEKSVALYTCSLELLLYY